MGRARQDTTPSAFLAAYEAICTLGATHAGLAGEKAAELPPAAQAMRRSFEARTGAFRAEDPWFEPRSRAFWDDALTTQGFAKLALAHMEGFAKDVAAALGNAHRGLFAAHDVTYGGARLVDVWSGAEFSVRHLDEAQALALEHAEGLVDARVVAMPAEGLLFLLPGAFHHGPDASEPLVRVLSAARERGMTTGNVLDTLLRMELVFRASSRVKAAFAYRVESLPKG